MLATGVRPEVPSILSLSEGELSIPHPRGWISRLLYLLVVLFSHLEMLIPLRGTQSEVVRWPSLVLPI